MSGSFERCYMTICMTALFGLAGCPSSGISEHQYRYQPLWNDLPAYHAPLQPDPFSVSPAELQEPTGDLLLRDVLALSLLHNPQLAGVAWSVRISEARALQAGLRSNPELEAEVEEYGGTGPRKGFSTAETTIRLSQLIELGGKRGARQRIASVETKLASYGYEAERLAVLTDATLAFIDVLVSQDRLELADYLFDLSQKTFAVVAERVRAGKVSPLEETKASIELINRKIVRSKAESDLVIMRKRLVAIWGGKEPQFQKAIGSLDRIEEIPPFDELESHIDQNPQIARWTGEMEHRLAVLSLERAERLFDFTLDAGIKRFEETDDYTFTLGLSLPLPLFNRNQGSVREARYRIEQIVHQTADARIRTSTALMEWYETLVSAREEAMALRDEVIPSARWAFEAARDGYRQGKFGYLEVLDAERTFAENNARLLDALGRFHRAVAVVESYIGTRLDALIEE